MDEQIKICVFSDTHSQHRDVTIPECDILIFAGDANINTYDSLNDFNNWIGDQPGTHKIMVGGNHDTLLQQLGKKDCKLFFTNVKYIENEYIFVKGIKIWGSPSSVKFMNWAFMKNDNELANIWNLIPKKIDIVITHGPAYGILDKNAYCQNCGSITLLEKIKEINPKYHISAHIHEQNGTIETEYTKHINASILDERYQLVNQPKVFYYEK